MAYTFGGAASDDISNTAIVDAGAASYSWLMCGWFKPTTLTSGRYLFATNNTNGGIRVGTTTSDLVILMDRVTTDRVMNHAIGMVVNVWQWLCVFVTVSSAGAGSTLIWRVPERSQQTPEALTMIVAGSATTGGSGNAVGGTARTVGNSSPASTTQAFQGHIGQIIFMSSQNNQPTASCFPIATPGTIASAEGEALWKNIVLPLYEGRIPEDVLRTAQSGALELSLYDLGCQPPVLLTMQNHVTTPTLPTITELVVNGAVWTEERPPFEYDFHAQFKRRRR